MKSLFLRRLFAAVIAILFNLQCLCADPDSVIIRVHFLHGSKPKRAYRFTEDRWFGGLLGGHAGVEVSPNRILDFQPRCRFHVFAKPRLINSQFSIHDTVSFYQILGSCDSVKRTVIAIRISTAQKRQLDSLASAYHSRSPYDYAFFGMRCGAAAYDVLATTGVLNRYSFTKTWRKTFYPRKLRRRLEHDAAGKNYAVLKTTGSSRRKWEKD